ncbi:hypothetical protein IV203_027401 [Nitzschia inconspicua]|uniref:Uncharacterized protein n=1 Tax=Nitzschia inconspicua TaxID=303405 RepID=A0A9K3Q442_9STRA|nr:hypothetical protein IV203_027401 [Nitzschia inconspicua]
MFAPLSVTSSMAAGTILSYPATSTSITMGMMILSIFSKNAAASSKVQSMKNRISTWSGIQQQQKVSKNPFLKLQKVSPPPPPPKRPNLLIQLYHVWFQLPQIFRFFVGGNLGNLSFFYTEQCLFEWLSTNPYGWFSLEFLDTYLAGMSFFVAYILQIVTTHLLFAFLVYGLSTIDSVEKYCKTLWGQFRVYFVSLIGSTILNTHLINQGVDKTLSFFGTMGLFACINYVLISKSVQRAVESSEHKQEQIKMTKSFTLGGWNVVNKFQRGGALFGVTGHDNGMDHLWSRAFVGPSLRRNAGFLDGQETFIQKEFM